MTVTARQNDTQQEHFIRYNLAFNSAPATAIQLSVGSAVPANAVVTSVNVAIQTAFNAGTTNTLDVGTAGAPTALVSAQALGSVGVTPVAPATLGGIMSSSVDTELFVRYNYTGTAPSAGAAVVTIFYVPNI